MELIIHILAWIFEIFGELGLQLLTEIVAEVFGHANRRRRPRAEPVAPWLAVVGCVVFGAIAGGISLWLVPELFLKNHWARIANVIVTPLISGVVMAWIGSWRRHHQGDLIRLDTFGYAFCFSLSMALVRFFGGQ